MEFPISQYVEASKKQYEREAYNPLGEAVGGLASGMGTGMVKGVDEQAKAREMVLQEYFKNNAIHDGDGNIAPPEVIMQVRQTGKVPAGYTISQIKQPGTQISINPITGESQTITNPLTGKPAGKEDKITKLSTPKVSGGGTAEKEDVKQLSKAKKEYIDAKTLADTAIPDLDSVLKLNENSVNGKLEGLAYKASQITGVGTDVGTFGNTAEVVQQLKSMVARVLKSQFGGQLSEGEREYLNSVYGASENYTKKEREIAIKKVSKMFGDKVREKKDAYEMWGGKDFSVIGSQTSVPQSNLKSKYGLE